MSKKSSFSTKDLGIISQCINCTNYPPLNQPQIYAVWSLGNKTTSLLKIDSFPPSVWVLLWCFYCFFGGEIWYPVIMFVQQEQRCIGLKDFTNWGAPQQFDCKCAVAPTFAFSPSVKCYITRVPLFLPFLYPYHNFRIFTAVS